MQRVFFVLLHHVKDFAAFFDYLKFDEVDEQLESLIYHAFYGKICSHSPIAMLVKEHPVELAYALALISTGDSYSITPPWLLHNYPNIENVLQFLCNTPCHDSNCEYCETKLNIYTGLKDVFGFDSFRTYDGEPLQEKAVQLSNYQH